MPNMEWYKLSKCERCVQDKELCVNCRDNPIYHNVPRHSFYMYYKPVCPRGFSDCVTDPAYIKFHYPDWYKELYGDKIEIMVGSGINAENVSKFYEIGIRNFHLSGKVQIDSLMTYRREGVSMGAISADEEYKITQTDYRKIEEVKKYNKEVKFTSFLFIF